MVRQVLNLDNPDEVVDEDDSANEKTFKLSKPITDGVKIIKEIKLSEPDADTTKSMMRALKYERQSLPQPVLDTSGQPVLDAEGKEVTQLVDMRSPTADSTIDYGIAYIVGNSEPSLSKEKAGKLPVSFVKAAAEFSARFLGR